MLLRGYTPPTAIAELVSWAAQARAKVSAVQEVLGRVCGARGTMAVSGASAAAAAAAGEQEAAVAAAAASCGGAAAELAKEVGALVRDALDRWQAATAAWLSGAAGWHGGALMSFDAASRRVRAHFSESLVALLREVRPPTLTVRQGGGAPPACACACVRVLGLVSNMCTLRLVPWGRTC